MKNILLLSIALLYIIASQAQQLPNRYIDEITNNVQVTTDIVFSTNIPTVTSTNLFGNRIANEESYGRVSTTLKMDIYQPKNDILNQRPVIIFAFGGGFVNGNRKEKSMIQLCEAFAKRGFVTATIDYRLGMNLNNPELSKRAVYRALQDGRSAVRFFRKNASAYGVDPNQIFLSGHSAGALLAYHAVYLDKDSERPASTRDYFGRPDLDGLDDIGDNKTYSNGSPVSGKANGSMGFAGAVGELSYIENATDELGVYFHSSNDDTVPFNSGEPFSNLSWIPGINLPTIFGSNQMSSRANSVGAPHTFYPYTNRGHGVHFDGSNLYPEIVPNGAKFFHSNLLRPEPTTIESDSCSDCTTRTYTATNDQAFYYDWQISGGTFLDRDPNSNIVTVQWDSNSVNRNLTVTPYSRQLARGSSFSLYPGSDNCNWQQTIGAGTDIGAGGGQTHVIGTNRKVFRWNGSNWNQIPGIDVIRLDTDGNGNPWVITPGKRVFRNIGNGWERINGIADDIGVSSGHVYVLGTDDYCYKYLGAGRWRGIKTRKAKRIDAAPNGDAWVIGSDNHVYQIQNNQYTAKKGNFRALDITVAEGSNAIWAVELGTGIPHKYLGNGIWESFRGALANISVNSNGELWGTNSAKGIFKNDCEITSTGIAATKQENSTRSTIKLYPNPATDSVNLDVSAYNGKQVKATLVNFLGQKVHTTVFKKANSQPVSVDVSRFKTGIYILIIEAEGEASISKRLVIK